MNGTIRKFMMEKPDSIYRNFRTPYTCIKNSYFTRRVECKLTENICYDKII